MWCLARKWTIPRLHHPRLRWAKRGGFAGKNGSIARYKEGGYGNRERCDKPTLEIVGAVLLKSWRPTPEAVGSDTAEVEEAYP